MATSNIILSQTRNAEVINFCSKVDASINAATINKELEVCITWGNKLSSDFYSNFSVVKDQYEIYL